MFEQTFKNIDDILHKDAGCTSELDYTEQSSWLLFLKYLDALEADKAMEAELEGRPYQYLSPGIKGEVDVMSFGADGQSGGEGDDQGGGKRARCRHAVDLVRKGGGRV